MQIIIHRVNTIAELNNIPKHYGVEIDIRGYENQLLLTHNPIDNPKKFTSLDSYLSKFQHAFIIFNIKEAGYEELVIANAQKYGIDNYFLLDVEFPYLYHATRKTNFRKIAVRHSEVEPIELVEAQIKNGAPLLDWVWIDTITRLSLTRDTSRRLALFKTCLVCPSRWGRSEDIRPYIKKMQSLNFIPNAIMTSIQHAPTWEKYYQKT